jgi:hypothetical protein
VLALALACGCGATPVVDAKRERPRAVVLVTTPSRAPAPALAESEAPAASADDDPPVLSLPAGRRILEDPSAAERRALDATLEAMCATRAAMFGGELLRGCTCCPPFDGCPPGSKPTPDGEIYPLVGVARGSFTRAGARELAATFIGCEARSGNEGGTVLYGEERGRLRRIRYESGLMASCVTVPRRERADVLLCRSADGRQGWYHDRVFTFDFTRATEEARYDTVVDVTQSLHSGCWSVDGFPVTAHVIVRLELVDADGDGDEDLVLTVEARKGRVDASFSATCRRDEEPDGDAEGFDLDRALRAHLGRARTLKLLYAFDGARFRATAETERVVAWLYREQDAFFKEVEGR